MSSACAKSWRDVYKRQAEYGLPVLAKLPIDPKLAAAVDAGRIEDAKLPDELAGALKAVEDIR